jgi:hypothetical protein
MSQIICPRDIMTPGNMAKMLQICSRYFSILRQKIWRSHKSRFQNKNVECTITTIGSSFSGFIAFRWKYHRGEGQYDRKRGARAVVYLPVCGKAPTLLEYTQINSNKPPICSKSELIGIRPSKGDIHVPSPTANNNWFTVSFPPEATLRCWNSYNNIWVKKLFCLL